MTNTEGLISSIFQQLRLRQLKSASLAAQELGDLCCLRTSWRTSTELMFGKRSLDFLADTSPYHKAGRHFSKWNKLRRWKEKDIRPKYKLIISAKNWHEKNAISKKEDIVNVQATEVLFGQHLLIDRGAQHTRVTKVLTNPCHTPTSRD